MTSDTDDATLQAAEAAVEDPASAAQERDPVTVRPVAFAPFDDAPDDGAPDDSAPSDGPRPLDLLLDIQVPVVVELGHTEMPIEDLLALKPGSVIELDRLTGEPADLLIRDHVVARGEIIVIDDNLGIRVTSIVDPTERVKNLGDA